MVETVTLYSTFQKISRWGGTSIFSAMDSPSRKKIQLLLMIVLIIIHPTAVLLLEPIQNDVVGSLYMAAFVVVAVSNLICNVYINFSQTDNFKKLLKCFAVLDFNLKRLAEDNVLKEDAQFYVYLTTSLLSLSGNVCMNLTYRTIKYDFIDALKSWVIIFTSSYLTFLLMLKVFQFACTVFTIKAVLKFLHLNLRRIFAKSWKMEMPHMHRREKLRSLMKCYDKVFEMVALCNKIFGVLILVVYPYLLIYFLRIITTCIKFKPLWKNALSVDLLLLVSDIFGCLFCVVSTMKYKK